MAPDLVRRLTVTGTSLVLACTLVPARAQVPEPQAAPAPLTQDWTDDVPAHLSYVDGTVTLERDNRLEPAEANFPLLAGDRLRTSQGRALVLYADGSTLAIDEDTELDFLDDSLVRLLIGRLRLTITRTDGTFEYHIDAAAGSAWFKTAGEYRVDAGLDRRGEPVVDLAVYTGSAELVNDFGRTLVRPGRHAVASADAEPSLPVTMNSAAWDEFDEWFDNQRLSLTASPSSEYLPEEVRYYSPALDAYGTWAYEEPYGNVWYPAVSVDWRPYSVGRWSFSAHFGWLWVGIDRWSWPTHHYGRWGLSPAGWYWIPDRRWAPAWVTWATAPGYVSWCPIGFDGRPIGGFRSGGPRGFDPGRAWTVMPSRHFTPNVWVTQNATAPATLTPAVRTQFTERPTPPSPSGFAVPRRELAPLRAPTRGHATPAARSSASDGPFDRARAAGRVISTAQPPVRSTIIGNARSAQAPPPGPAGRVVDTPGRPDPTEVRPAPSRGANSPARVIAPRVEAPGASRPPTPSRAVPRQSVPPPANDPPRAQAPPAGQRAPQVQRASPSTPPPASRDRGARAAERQAPPPSPPAAAPPRSSSPPARGRSVDPPKAAPPQAAPPSRGGGGQSRAVPRTQGRGGGGGG